MKQRRETNRNLCAELVTIRWTDEDGGARSDVVALEDISATGACIHLEDPIPAETEVTLEHPNAKYLGRIKYCVFQEFGYFLVGIGFDKGYRWSKTDFQPSHLLELPVAGKSS